MGWSGYKVVSERFSVIYGWCLLILVHPNKCICLCMHSRLDMHHCGHYVVCVIMMLFVCYDVDMLAEME